jgi:hypothetical protein
MDCRRYGKFQSLEQSRVFMAYQAVSIGSA